MRRMTIPVICALAVLGPVAQSDAQAPSRSMTYAQAVARIRTGTSTQLHILRSVGERAIAAPPARIEGIDPQLEDAARGMGRRPLEVFREIVLPQLWPVLAAGALLVALYVVSDFGAVSLLRFETFTSEIYVAYRSSFDRTAAAALGAVLVVVMLILLLASSRLRSARVVHRLGPGTQRPARPYRLGRWRWPALGFCAALTAVAFALPVGVLVYWASEGISSNATTLGRAAALSGNTLMIAAFAAAIGALAAALFTLPKAMYLVGGPLPTPWTSTSPRRPWSRTCRP